MSQSGDDPSSSPLFSTPPNEIYFAEKTLEEGITKDILADEMITTSPKIKLNSLEKELMTEKVVKTEEMANEGGSIETFSEDIDKLNESMTKNLWNLDQQHSLVEDKCLPFCEEENASEDNKKLNKNMNNEEENGNICHKTEKHNEPSLLKFNNDLLIDINSQKILRESTSPVIFFSPNNTKISEMPIKQNKQDITNSNTLKSNNLLTTTTTSTISCLKMSNSIADLLPSRFPIEEGENKNNKGSSKLETIAAKTAKMAYSATFNNTFPSSFQFGEGDMNNENKNIVGEIKIFQKPLDTTAMSVAHNHKGEGLFKILKHPKINFCKSLWQFDFFFIPKSL